MPAALARLQELKDQNPSTWLRMTWGHQPVIRTFPSQEALLRFMRFRGATAYLGLAMPTNFASWATELSTWYNGILAGTHDLDAALLYTAARFGQAQLCGLKTDATFHHLGRVLEYESYKASKRAAWDEVGLFPGEFYPWDYFISFRCMELHPAAVTSLTQKKFNFACQECGREGICMCIFTSTINRLEGMAKQVYCTTRAMRELLPAKSMRQKPKDRTIMKECFCLEEDTKNWAKPFNCPHAFHTNCVAVWILQNRDDLGKTTCPSCRAQFGNRDLAWTVTEYMAYVRQCSWGLSLRRGRQFFEKQDAGLGSARKLEPVTDLRVAPYELLLKSESS